MLDMGGFPESGAPVLQRPDGSINASVSSSDTTPFATLTQAAAGPATVAYKGLILNLTGTGANGSRALEVQANGVMRFGVTYGSGGNYVELHHAAGEAITCRDSAGSTANSFFGAGNISGSTSLHTQFVLAFGSISYAFRTMSFYAENSGGATTGVMQINNGTPDTTTGATLRDLRLRNLIAAIPTTTATSADGVVLQTTTAATVGAQQYSPRVRWKGSGWGTTGAAAQAVEFIAEVQPSQGAAAPSGLFVISSAINGGSYAPKMSIDSAAAGGMTLAGTTSVSLSMNASGGHNIALGSATTPADSLTCYDLTASGSGGWLFTTKVGQFNLGTSAVLGWGPNATSPDVGLARNAAGVVEANNGTRGTLRDISARAHIFGSSYTVATLPSAASSAGYMVRISDLSSLVNGSTATGGGALSGVAVSNGTNWIVHG